MSAESFLTLDGHQWMALVAAALALLLLPDAFAGHSRAGFWTPFQYAPLASGTLLALAGLAAALRPRAGAAQAVLLWSGGLAAAAGMVGAVFHHLYGIARRPGGYRWLRHHLLYGAPPLAPLGLTAAGLLGVLAARGLAGAHEAFGLALPRAGWALIALALLGSVAQASLLHYRGAFHDPFMYAPLTSPLAAAAGAAWAAAAPEQVPLGVLTALLWLTFLTGFVGVGMHLRGFDRQMGGLYVGFFNWLEGPPAFAPGLFAALAAAGLVVRYLF